MIILKQDNQKMFGFCLLDFSTFGFHKLTKQCQFANILGTSNSLISVNTIS